MRAASTIAAAMALTGCVLIAGCLAPAETGRGGPERTEVRSRGLTARLPAGWTQADAGSWRRFVSTGNPAPLLVAASAPFAGGGPLGVCARPEAAIDRIGPGGVLVEIDEVDPGRLTRRPHRIRLSRRTFAPYECSGPSHLVYFREGSRGIAVHVWLDPSTVDPAARAAAVRLLNSIRVSSYGSGECGEAGGSGFEGRDGLSCREAALLWRHPPRPPEALRPCPSRFAVSHRIEATGKVACRAVERFILGDFAPHPGGWVERAGRFDCRITDAPGRPGIGATCVDGSRGAAGPRFRFRFY